MRVLSKSLFAATLAILMAPIAARAADLDYEYAPPPPPRVYEERAYLPPPPPPPVVQYVEPPPYYARPYRSYYGDFYARPRLFPGRYFRPYAPQYGYRRFGSE